MRRRVNAAAGGTVLHRSYPSGRDWHELRLSLTAAALDDLETDALGTLVACFLVGVAVAEAALAKALGQDSTAQLRRAGVLVDVDDSDGRRCCGALQLFPILDDDVIATDWSSETLLDANDAVMSVGTESLELALLAPPPKRGARVLDLCCGSGVQGVVALCRGAASVTFARARVEIFSPVAAMACRWGLLRLYAIDAPRSSRTEAPSTRRHDAANAGRHEPARAGVLPRQRPRLRAARAARRRAVPAVRRAARAGRRAAGGRARLRRRAGEPALRRRRVGALCWGRRRRV